MVQKGVIDLGKHMKSKSRLKEGMAVCVFDEGMEDKLAIGEVAYVREIPKMPGHCIILRNEKAPLVGYHLDRFRMLKRSEV